LGWHTPATQDAVAAHCASLLQVLVVAQAAPEHPPGPHASCTLAGHVPEPLQAAGSVITPAEHDPARHSTDAPGYAHWVASLPSHEPPQAVPSDPQACRDPCGAPTTLAQVPTWPGTSQAWHCPPQATLQQTPSTHWPLVH